MSKIVDDNKWIPVGMIPLYAAVPDNASMNDVVVVKGHVDVSSDPNTTPTEPDDHIDYLQEPVHVLAFTDAEVQAWPDIWLRRKSEDSTPKASNEIIELFGITMSQKVFAEYISEKYPHMYSDDIRVESYHPEVFPQILNPDEKFPPNTIIFPDTTPRGSAMLRKIGTNKQRGYDINIKKHNQRLEIAAKAALLLYRCSEAEAKDETKISKGNTRYDDIKLDKKLKQASDAYSDALNDKYDRAHGYKRVSDAIEEYKDAQNAFSVKANLTQAVVDEIGSMSDPSMDLSNAFDVYRKNSCYGLWGKWYTTKTGFHRGIDITFGEGVPICSICKGRVVKAYDADDWTYRTIQIEHPTKFRGLFLTYMHASFSIKNKDEIVLGQQIGTEDNFVPGGGDSHTHIELNGNNADKFGQNKKSVIDPVGSIEPYSFIEECFKDFYDAVKIISECEGE